MKTINEAANGQKEFSGGLRILRLPAVIRKTGLSKSTIYQRLRSCEFPEPIRLGARAVGFCEHEVDRYVAALIQRSRGAHSITNNQ